MEIGQMRNRHDHRCFREYFTKKNPAKQLINITT